MNGSLPALVVSSNAESRDILVSILAKEGFHTVEASRLSECLALLPMQNVGLIFCERHLADGTYHELVSATRPLNRRVPVIVTSRLADWDEYLEALRNGAFDLIASPCQPNDVFWALQQIDREKRGLSASVNSAQRSTIPADEVSDLVIGQEASNAANRTAAGLSAHLSRGRCDL